MLARGGNRYSQVLPPDTVPLSAVIPCFHSQFLSTDWWRHYYWHPRHGLRDVIVPSFWRSVIGNLHHGDIIHCELGPLGERLLVDLGVVSEGENSAEVSIVRRDKETPVAAAHFEEPKAKGGKAA